MLARSFFLTILLSTFLFRITFGRFCCTAVEHNVPEFEVIAFNYFADSIFYKEFKKSEKIFYDRYVSDIVSGTTYLGCFKDYYTKKDGNSEKRDLISENNIDLVLKVRKDNFLPKMKSSRITKRNYLMEVYKANSYKISSYFVEIVIFKNYMRAHFWIEIDLNGDIKRWCKFDVME